MHTETRDRYILLFTRYKITTKEFTESGFAEPNMKQEWNRRTREKGWETKHFTVIGLSLCLIWILNIRRKKNPSYQKNITLRNISAVSVDTINDHVTF